MDSQMYNDITAVLTAKPENKRELYRIAMDLLAACGQAICDEKGRAAPSETLTMAHAILEEAVVDMARILHSDKIREEGEE